MPARAFRRKLRIGYLAPVLAMALLAGFVLWRVNAEVSITKWVEHSDDVLLLAKNAGVQFRRMQAAFSAYVASRDTRYLIQLREAGDAFDRNLEDVAVSVTDNSQQERRWKRFTKTYVPGKFEELGKNDSREPPSVIFAKADAYGQHVLEALDAFTAAEYALRTQRIANQGRVNQAIIVLVPLLSLL
jgi:CHASE3 domain